MERTGSFRSAVTYPGFVSRMTFLAEPNAPGSENGPGGPVASISVLMTPTGPAVMFTGQVQQQVVDELENLFMKIQATQVAKGQAGPIKFMIQSPGGEVGAGFQLYDLMINMNVGPTPIHTEARGMAASMAAMWLLAGEKRTARAHASIMLHKLSINGMVSANPDELTKLADDMHRAEEAIDLAIAKRTGKSLKVVQDMLAKGDQWFHAKEALAFGIIDSINDLSNGAGGEVMQPKLTPPSKIVPLRPNEQSPGKPTVSGPQSDVA